MQSRAKRTCQLRKRGNGHFLSQFLFKHLNEEWIVRHHSSTHDYIPIHRVHLKDSFDYRSENALYDVRHIDSCSYLGQDFGTSKYSAVAADLNAVFGFLGQPIEFPQVNLQTICNLLEKRAGAGGTLPIHLEAGSFSGIIDLYDFAVLSSDVNQGVGAREIVEAAGGMAAYLSS
jgi:hypothetical protein